MIFRHDDSGQGLLEYALVLGLLAMLGVGSLLWISTAAQSPLARAGRAMPAQGTMPTTTAPGDR